MSAVPIGPAAAGDHERPAGVVFDCDGTLADTESLIDQVWIRMLRERGYDPSPEDFAAVVGHPFPQNWAYFTARASLGDEASFRRELRSGYQALVETDLELHHDAIDTLRALVDAGIPVGVASSSSHKGVLHVLDRAGITELVEVVVGADDVAHHKPHPEPYLTAVAALGQRPQDCAAVEDTVVGVTSAVAAGLFTVAVVRAHGSHDLLARADRTVDQLSVAALIRPR
jgi:HAD superfamily hydrolase (TIGR01509 family)